MMYRVGTPAMCYNNKDHGSRKGTSQERHDVRLSPCWQADMTLQLQSKINYDHTNRMQQRPPEAAIIKADFPTAGTALHTFLHAHPGSYPPHRSH
ncbi:hypothetical protein ATANTOWER_009129 [Ataeniobius toweri]|uniref:Uncharacterized protein n=1 Tax=Ataeniobius toweri TaxID=208326 RepID=A0ABU7A574_9TELE|nr:hypothetical protein [Ataeniobius toweri]